jgi:hypothetical protein
MTHPGGDDMSLQRRGIGRDERLVSASGHTVRMEDRQATQALPIGVAEGRLVVASLAALLAIGTAHLADLTTFLPMIAVGGFAAEANPIVATVGESFGVGALVALKLVLIPFVAVIFMALARIRARLAASVLTVATLTGLAGAFSNVLAFF